ncbi:unnamed protein product [Candida verbasci]|uniref:E3 ubiquitin protein ligase n=1 Tax=Candida verbasci TaxID=1227364 RepID=A0A9W4TYP3_9ASCO|nr:unnamed protein product [Candida verbasci]
MATTELKRSLNDDDYETTSKAKRLKLSDEGPLTATDILIFKKECLFREMTLYKHKLNLLEKEVNQDNLIQEIMDLKRELLKYQSPAISRVLKNATSANRGIEESDKSEETAIKKEATPEEKQINIQEDKLAEYLSQIEVLTSTNKLLKSQLEEISEQYQQALIQPSKSKLSNEDEAKLQKLTKNNKFLQDEISKLNKIKSLKVSENFETFNNLKEELDKEIITENERLKNKFQDQEITINRLRAHRDELSSQIEIIKQELDNKETNKSLLDLNSELNKRIEQLTKPQSDENEVIQEIEQAFKQTRDLYLSNLSNKVDIDGKLQIISIEKTKAESKYFAVMRSMEAAKEEIKILKLQNSKQNEFNTNLTELNSKLNLKVKNLTTQLSEYQQININNKNEVKKVNEDLEEFKIDNSNLKENLEEITTKNENLIKSEIQLKKTINQQSIEIQELEKKKNQLSNLLNKYKTNNVNGIIEEEEQQLQALRSIAKCSVCTKNWKDTAITVCGHVFCSNCTQERLAARLRRCPSCNKGFSQNDLLSIHL